MKNKTFCVMPFLHLNVWPNGNLKPCCISNEFQNNNENNIINLSTKDAYNSEEYKKLRLDMINGVENNLCSGCYDSERIHSVSYRMSQLEKYKDVIDESIASVKEDGQIDLNFRDLDLRLSNLCNLKCRGCNDTFSSSWEKEANEFSKFIGWDVPAKKVTSFNLDIDKSDIENLTHLYFAGGEPMIMNEMYNFFNKIEDKGKILVFINTNFTNVNFKMFEDNFSKFKLVQFIISCDGIDEVGKYTRTNLNWKKYVKNLDILTGMEKKMNNINHIFQYTCSILNCFHFFEFRDFMYDNGYVNSDEQIKFGFIEGPPWLSILNFNTLKMEVITHFEERLNLINLDSNLYTEINNFLNYLKETQPSTEDNRFLLKSVIEFGHDFNKTKLPKELKYIEKLYE